jgi:hypothetical protein
MEVEYAALIMNGTWHLVPYRQGMNIIDCNGYLRSREEQMVQLIGIRED